MRFRMILNRDGGTLKTTDLDAFTALATTNFEAEGHKLECVQVRGNEVEAALQAAAEDDGVDGIIAGGGDGTISVAAAVAYHCGKPLGVLPAGTMNMFARAIGGPMDLTAAISALAAGRIAHVDVATANGRPFVFQFGVGVHARLVRIRNSMTYHGRIGKMLASLRAVFSSMVNPPRFAVEIETAQGLVSQHSSGLAVSNNPVGAGGLPVAARLDSGKLGVYVAGALTSNALLGLVKDIVTGQWRDNPSVTEIEARKVVLTFPKRKRGVFAVIDGELIPLEEKVVLELKPLSLAIVQPATVV